MKDRHVSAEARFIACLFTERTKSLETPNPRDPEVRYDWTLLTPSSWFCEGSPCASKQEICPEKLLNDQFLYKPGVLASIQIHQIQKYITSFQHTQAHLFLPIQPSHRSYCSWHPPTARSAPLCRARRGRSRPRRQSGQRGSGGSLRHPLERSGLEGTPDICLRWRHGGDPADMTWLSEPR